MNGNQDTPVLIVSFNRELGARHYWSSSTSTDVNDKNAITTEYTGLVSSRGWHTIDSYHYQRHLKHKDV